jgi:RNA polymerase sigma-70 factor (ECF subfamily)
LLEEHRDYLLAIARAELDGDLRCKAGPSDLVQETFLEAQRDFSQFPGESRDDLLRWLREILRHNLADFVRRYRQTARRDVQQEQSLDAAEGDELENQISADTALPEDRVLAAEQREMLARAMERLPEEQRKVMQLRHANGASWAEIAEQMGRSSGAVQKLWVRALERLRQHMNPG